MHFSVKHGTTSVPSPFKRLKMLFVFKRDQKCKNSLFWTKSVNFAKKRVPAEKVSF